MREIAIIYGTTSDNTRSAAEQIQKKLTNANVTVIDVAKLKTAADIEKYPNLILGTSTLGLGDLQDDWEGYVSELEKADLEGKTIALFGLGDSYSYGDTFVDGLGHLYEAVKDKGAKIVGSVPTSGYSFDSSIAVVDGEFVGLPLDEDNESDQTEERISEWVAKIDPEFA